jgi:two-component system, chemotaxis family, CheB/CheR fusion protein
VSAAVPLVGIGASAGGLEALSELLEALPPLLGAAVIVVQHLDRSRESLLREILARKTALPVIEAVHGLIPQADSIYVIPPDVTLTVVDGHLHLDARPMGRAPHLPIDALFKSLAQECGGSGIGIVLSGADSDGAAGIQAIKTAGGITFAQQPRTARFPSMPQSAIETGCVDFVLTPILIAAELARIASHPYLRAVEVASEPESSGRIADSASELSLKRVFRRLRAAHGVDFSRYKPATLQRRLARRMALQRIDNIDEYLALIDGDPAEVAALYQDFLIRVTSFFRDPAAFQALNAQVFPDICASRSSREPIRIWVAGCATGEEVYSIAIALVEFLGERSLPIAVQIFGTDVSELAIQKARSGRYLESIALDLSAERLSRFFVKDGGQYCVVRSIRELCVFARQDVTRDPPFSRLDLISCRNLLIYLSNLSQQRVMQIFHYALRQRGILMLGPAESIGHMSDLFDVADKEQRFYKPRLKPTRVGFENSGRFAGPAGAQGSQSTESLATGSGTSESPLRQADRWFLARYAPAGILIDESLNILQFRGETGPLLAPASGTPSLNLQRVVRPELLLEMLPALEEARHSGAVIRRPGLSLAGAGVVDMEVIPLAQPASAPCYLFVFEDETHRAAPRRERALVRTVPEGSDKDRRIAQVERENTDLREFLRATMEQQEAAGEELRSANEEVLSANEEFQSTNEELETSKEELQSANEELLTTNEELRDRNRQLNVLNAEVDEARALAEAGRAYADEIIETVREPLLVLDDELRISRANKAFYSLFDLRLGSLENGPVHEIGDIEWNADALRAQLLQVLAHGESLVDFEIPCTLAGRGRRLLFLNARRIAAGVLRAPLILLSIEDITEVRNKADTLREGSRRKDEFLAMLAHELRNPLGPISHAVQLLKRGAPDAARLHNMIERQTVRLVSLVDELLDVARISRGLIELKREPVDMVAIVRNAIEAARPRLDERGHTLSLSLPDESVLVDGDPVRLEQVVSNLLENAAKYTNSGGQVGIELVAAGGDAVLQVIDNGIGLEADVLERIFDLFNQVDSSLARSGGGLGLGLTVVRRVLEMHAGRIEAHSAGLGKGSEFVVRIPLLPKSDAPEPPRHTSRPVSGESVRRRILLVDDNVDAAESMSLLLTSWGHDVVVAHTALHSIEIAQRFLPQTALLDIGLPDMDGYALARRLRETHSTDELQLIAMTGYGRAEDRAAARAAGFDVHLVKPADLGQLARMLDPRSADVGPAA